MGERNLCIPERAQLGHVPPRRRDPQGLCVACGAPVMEVQSGIGPPPGSRRPTGVGHADEIRSYVGHRYAVAWQEVCNARRGEALLPRERLAVYALALCAVERLSEELVVMLAELSQAEVREVVERAHLA